MEEKDVKKEKTKEYKKKSRDSKKESDRNKKSEVQSEVIGKFIGKERGYGFVTVEGEEDVFIPPRQTLNAMNGDTVLVKITQNATSESRREGTVTKVVKREITNLVGIFYKSKNCGFVVPNDLNISQDIYISKEHTKGAKNGSRVYVRITDYGKNGRSPEGRVTEIIGHISDASADVRTVLLSYGIDPVFPISVEDEVSHVPSEVSAEEITGRVDYRSKTIVTIDGVDAKDLDDAISVERTEIGYELGVHIADVTHYVKEDAPLDNEAYKRGTSVYLIDTVVPMLPKTLSNGICSLNEGCDRLTLSCMMDIDKTGQIVGHRIEESVIRVTKRMSYPDVDACLNGEADYKELNEKFKLMKELSDLLRERRRSRGAVDFEFPETKVVLNEKGYPVKIGPYDRTPSTKIIEDFMLAANETVAEDFFWQEVPFVYRTHENPDPEKIKQLGIFVQNFGLTIKVGRDGEVHPKEIQKILDNMTDNEEAPLISRLTLRSMKQAKYTTDCDGHFGLAARYYCHFTSPIRRYPDLQIHRIIKENLKGILDEDRKKHYEQILTEVADHSSKTERNADEAERDIIKCKMTEYMERKVGEVFEGVISGVTNHGIYVELPNTIEGLIRIEALMDDRYRFDRERYTLTGERRGKIFKLGQRIKVTLIGVDKALKSIDFLPYNEL